MKKIFLLVLVLMTCNIVTNAADTDSYYTNKKIKGYEKADFLVLNDDDINFRAEPRNGKVLKVLPHHSLLRILDKKDNWLKADADGMIGYLYAPFTVEGQKESLTEEDFIVSYAVFGERFNEQHASEILGNLQSSNIDKKHKLINYKYNGAVIGVDKRKKTLTSITVSDAKFITMRGISVGDNAGRAVGQYGLPDGVIYNADSVVYEYYWQNKDEKPMLFSVMVNEQSKIKEITLKKLYK